MELQHFVIDANQAAQLNRHLQRFMEETDAEFVLLMGRDGTLQASCASETSTDLDIMCALSVGLFVSSEALAAAAGETGFNSICHQGAKSNVYIVAVGDDHLLLAMLPQKTNMPQVRLKSRVAAEAIADVVARSLSRGRDSAGDIVPRTDAMPEPACPLVLMLSPQMSN